MREEAATTPLPTGTVEPVAGHQLRLLLDGQQGRNALFHLIAGATTSLRLFYYLFEADRIGTEVRDALITACGRGVRVHLAVDGFGSSDTPDSFFESLVSAGARFCRFHPRWGRNYVLRNHQKLAIADGHSAMVGGFNIADPYFDPDRTDSWRDLGLVVSGEAVAQLAMYFDRLFAWIIRDRISLFSLRRLIPAVPAHADQRVRWVFGGPSRRLSPYARQVQSDFRSGSRLDMMMAYFAPNRRFIALIGDIATRGAARLINAGKTDVALSRAAAWSTYGRLLRQGTQIAEFQPAALHAKLIIIDNITYMGSGNFDIRSLHLNLEVMLRIDDAAFAAQMRTLFDREWQQSDLINPAVYKRLASWWNRFRWRFAYWIFATVDFATTRRLTRL